MKDIKYLHVLGVNETNYSYRIVSFFSRNSLVFGCNRHYFTTPHKDVYDNIKDSPNVVVIDLSNKYNAKFVKLCCTQSCYVILHALPPYREVIRFNSFICKKIIWRTWGHDYSYITFKEAKGVRERLKWLLQFLALRKIRLFKAIGGSNIVDRLTLEASLGCVFQFYKLPYPSINSITFQNQNHSESNELGTFKILLGHSGYQNDNHIKIFNSLKHIMAENIQIYCPLSYGDPQYIESLISQIQDNYGGKIKVIKELMPYDKFVEFLSTIDMAIFDGIKSYALGNIFLLINLRKKIYLNEEGILFQSLKKLDIPCFSTRCLCEQSLEQLKQPVRYPQCIPEDFRICTNEEYVNMWQKLLQYLN